MMINIFFGTWCVFLTTYFERDVSLFSDRDWHSSYTDLSNLILSKRRQPQKVVAGLKGYEETGFPEKVTHVIYDTGIEKRGTVVKLG